MGSKQRRLSIILIILHILVVLFCLAIWNYIEAEPKLLFIMAYSIASIIFCVVTKNLILTSVIGFLLILPFNITLLLPIQETNAFINGIYVNYLAPVVSITDIAILMIFISLIIELRKKVSLFITPVIILILMIYGIVHFNIHSDITVLVQTMRIILYASTATIVLGEYELVFKRIRKHLVFAISISVLIQTLIGLFQFLRGNSIGIPFFGESQVSAGLVGASTAVLDGNLYLRAYGTFPHPNVLAGYYLLAILALLSLLKGHKDQNNKPLIYFALVTSLIGISLTLSQSAWLTLVIIMFLLLIPRSVKKELAQKSKSTAHHNRANNILIWTNALIPKTRSIQERISLLLASLDYLQECLLFGVGNGNFTRYFYEYAPLGAAGLTLMQPVHNIFILFVVENGLLIGGGVVGWFIISVVKRILRRQFDILALAALVILLIVGNVDHYLLTLPQGMAMLYLLMIMIFKKIDTESVKYRAF